MLRSLLDLCPTKLSPPKKRRSFSEMLLKIMEDQIIDEKIIIDCFVNKI
jgi:hypothetical protein